MKPIKFAYFGTPEWSARTLDILHSHGYTPSLIVTNPPRPQGRGLVLKPSPVHEWGLSHKIETLTPDNIDESTHNRLEQEEWDLFIVVAYGKILPSWLLDLPHKKTLNIHFSALPKYRGATPVETQIKDGAETTGVSIIVLDEKVDHGPLVALTEIPMPTPLPTTAQLGEVLVPLGADLLVDILPGWISGSLQAKEQNHDKATFTRKFSKAEGELDLSLDDEILFRTIQAFNPNPGTYLSVNTSNGKPLRIKILSAELHNEKGSSKKLRITSIVPEGKAPITLKEYLSHNPYLYETLKKFA